MRAGLNLEPARYATTGPYACADLTRGFSRDDCAGALDAPLFMAQGSVQGPRGGDLSQVVTAWTAVVNVDRIRTGGWQ